MSSFRSLLRKEWLAQRPFVILAAALFIFGLFMAFFTEFLDQYPIWDCLFDDSNGVVQGLFILAAIVGRGLAVREKDEGTLNFLDGLPVSRFSAYFAKWLVAVAILVGLHLLWDVEALFYEWLSKTSVSDPTPWRSILIMVGLQVFLTCYFVSGWCAISCLRWWDLLILGGIVMIIRWMINVQIPYADWLNPFTLIKPPSEPSDVWQIPWGHIWTLAVAGALAWMIGLAFFSIRDSFGSRIVKVIRQTWWGKLAGCLPFILIPVVWIIFLWTSDPSLFEVDADGNTGSQTKTAEAPNGLTEKETDHFVFVYREVMTKRLTPVINTADKSLATVSKFLDAPDDLIEGKIVVDLSSPIGQHNAGQAYWKKIRMTLPPKFDAKDNQAVLGHEITHVIIDQITDGRASDSFDSTRWFHEGLASYLEFHFFGKTKKEEEMTRWTALATSWGEIKFSEMVRNSDFSTKRDSNAVYPAGKEWLESLVDVYGDNAPAKLLRAIGRKDAPKKISGMTFWRDACLSAGFDLERVNGRFRERLSGLREKYADQCQKFPEITEAKVKAKDGKIVITPELGEIEIPEGAKIICRVRTNNEEPGWMMHYAFLEKDKTFQLSALSFPGPTLDFQIGWIPGKWLSLPVMGEWVDATVKRDGK